MEVAPPPGDPETPQPPRPPAPKAEGGACPRCGSPYEPLQEYCLECGLRLPLAEGTIVTLSSAWRRRVPWYPGDWIWPVLLLLLVAALGGLIAYLATADQDTKRTVIATTETGAATTTATTPTTPTLTTPTTATTATTPPTTLTQAPPPPPPPPSSSALVSWPSGTSGYTTVLQSIPITQGKAVAVAFAKRASAAGLTQVGYLDSSQFSSLHPGFYVVFSGIYDSSQEAESNTSTAASSGFPSAYPRQVVP